MSRSFQTPTTPPDSITPIMTLETGGRRERTDMSLRMTDCWHLGFPDPWNTGCIFKIHNTSCFFPWGFQRTVSTCADVDLELSPLFCTFKPCMSLSFSAVRALAVPSLSFLANVNGPTEMLSAVRCEHPEHLITSFPFGVSFFFCLSLPFLKLCLALLLVATK